MSGQMNYSAQMSASSSRRTSLSPAMTSASASQYGASRSSSMSNTSSQYSSSTFPSRPPLPQSSSSQAQTLLTKMVSQGAGSPPGSRLMTPAMTPFPSPADEFGGGLFGMPSSCGSSPRPGTERSLSQNFGAMQYDGGRQSAAEVMNLDAPARHLYETLERMAR